MLFMAFLVLLTPLQWFACNGHGIRSLMVRVRHVRLRPLLLALAARLQLMFLVLALRRCLHGRPRRYRRFSQAEVTIAIRRNRPKPDWVKQEVLRLAALSGAGCRSIEKLFNRIYATSRKMMVSKSYVHYTIRKHRYEIEVLRRNIRRRHPRPVPRNHVWAMDMTGKGDVGGEVHAILGIVDHGSRKLLALEILERRNAWTLLGRLFLAIGRYGKPRSIRSDNDAVFKSHIFRCGCKLAGIRQQFSVPGCPWMNGRIERLFGTLKHKLGQVRINGKEALMHLLPEFRFWYNAVRPHQNLGGATPDEAWHGVNPYYSAPKSMHWFEAWDGLLTGFYLRR